MARKQLILVSAGLFMLIFLWLGLSLTAKASIPFDGIVVAHRGASGYAPENTMASFELAVKMGADFIEIDLQMSKDGKLVVIHDDTVNRTTNRKGFVKDLTLWELQALDSGSFFLPQYARERIPELQEVMDRFSERIGILIELKNPSLHPGMEEKVAKIVKKYESKGNIIIQSFDHESMRRMHDLLPEIPVGVLVSKKHNHPLTNKKLNEMASYATYINYNFELLDEIIIKKIHAKNRKVMLWTIREEKHIVQAAKLGVDGIITNYPDWFID